MAFGRLLDLGPQGFQTIITLLLRRVPALSIARTIQQKWAACRDYPESKLANQLRRLYDALLRGAFWEDVQNARGTTDGQPGNPGLECLREMQDAAHLQLANILRLQHQGCAVPTPAVRAYIETIGRIQESHFDLGFVEYRRGQPIAALREENAKKQRDEAYTVANDILSEAGIDDVPPEEVGDGNAY